VLDGDRLGLRFGAIYCLQEIGDTRAILPLVEIMRIADINVGSEVSDALAKFGEPAFEPALNALRHKNKNVQRGAAQTLARMKDARAVTQLLTALKEDDIKLRQEVIFALGEIGDSRAFEPLIAALKDENPDIRWSAVLSLGYLGDKAAIPHLIKVMNDPDEDVRKNARRVLQKLEPV
jgi:HEAT repeat protein